MQSVNAVPKQVHVCHLIPSLGMGGAERLLTHISRFQDPARFRMTVVHWGDSALADEIRLTGVEVVTLSPRKVLSGQTVTLLARELHDRRVDVLHTHFMDADWLGFWAARRAGVPQIMQVHNIHFPEKWTHALRYRLMSFWGARIIVVSRVMQRHLAASCWIDPRSMTVIPNGTAVREYGERSASPSIVLKRALGLAPDTIVIGNVSRLVPDKDQDVLIQAFARVQRDHSLVRLLLVGDGPRREELMALVRALGITDKVIFAGTRRDVPELLALMTVFVFCARREGFGLSLLEAAATGRPIIAVEDPAARELLAPGKEALFTPPGNAAAMAAAILDLLQDSAGAARLAAGARLRAGAFDAALMACQLEQIYDEAVRR